MTQVDCIKEMQAKRLSFTDICTRTNLDPKTVRKYMAQEDFSPPAPSPKKHKSIIDEFKPAIEEMLDHDTRVWRKQHHTAARICKRLIQEYGAQIEYSTVQRYVKQRRQERKETRTGFNELKWDSGEAQVDFGEAEFETENGMQRHPYLVMSLPYSNAGFKQVFDGETAECVCEGLQAIFRHLGGCPRRLIFDNATGVGRRMEKGVRMAELFSRFKAHHGFEVTFCNPNSGNEKGNVENKVGYERRNDFVPVPYIGNIREFNCRLLDEAAKDFNREHYKKERLISELLVEDIASFMELPRSLFDACRYVKVKTDGYGKFCLDGCHHYSSAPEYAIQEIMVRIGAFSVAPLTREAIPISEHRREYGEARTDITDYRTTISQLVKTPGAWRNSGLRGVLTGRLRDEMDNQGPGELRATLRTMNNLWDVYGLETAISALEEAAAAGRLDRASSTVVAMRLATQGLFPTLPSGPDLAIYDRQLLEPARKDVDLPW